MKRDPHVEAAAFGLAELDLPPSAVTRRCTMARPSPVPPRACRPARSGRMPAHAARRSSRGRRRERAGSRHPRIDEPSIAIESPGFETASAFESRLSRTCSSEPGVADAHRGSGTRTSRTTPRPDSSGDNASTRARDDRREVDRHRGWPRRVGSSERQEPVDQPGEAAHLGESRLEIAFPGSPTSRSRFSSRSRRAASGVRS